MIKCNNCGEYFDSDRYYKDSKGRIKQPHIDCYKKNVMERRRIRMCEKKEEEKRTENNNAIKVLVAYMAIGIVFFLLFKLIL